MNTKLLISPAIYRGLLCAWVGLVAGGLAVAAPTNLPAKTDKTAGTMNAPILATIEVPQSQFTIPTSVTEGRDPFFPSSTRLGTGKVASRTTVERPRVMPELKGISGKFALINNRTFAAGEDGEVTIGKVKVHIRCVSIKEDSVLIELEGKPLELKLRPGL